MPDNTTTYRVFVSSPGDVQGERDEIKEVVEQINKTQPHDSKVKLEVWRWEDNMASQIGPAPQEVVNRQLPTYDIYVGILSGHFGTPTDKAGSGTEEEFLAALDMWKKRGSPWITFFFDQTPKAPAGTKATQQYLKVQEFKESLQQQKLGLYGRYSSTSRGSDSFRSTIDRHLRLIFIQLQSQQSASSVLKGSDTSVAGPAPTPPPSDSPAISFYLQKLADNHRTLAMRGMNVDFGVELPIDEVYVPLRTTRGRMDQRSHSERAKSFGKFGDVENFMDRDIELDRVFHECNSQKYRGLILLGEPGSGKTTGARQLAWRLASGTNRPEELGLPAGMRPVFLRLRNLDPALIDTQKSESDRDFSIRSLRQFLDQETCCPGGASNQQNPGPELWDDQQRGLLWILDGLDEVVDPKLRAIVAGWIRDILPERPRDRFFVTSRFHGYRQRDIELGEAFLEFEVKPLDQEQIERFVTQWFQAAHRRIDGNTSEADRNAVSDREQLFEVLKTAPYQSPNMLAMIANPMLLTIVCIVFKRDHNLPTARAELYRQCVKVLLESWRAEKFRRTKQQLAKPFDVEAARSVLSKLAWWMHQEKDRSEVPITDLAAEATQALRRVSPDANLGIDGDDFIGRMRNESGILAMSGEGRGKVGFLHLSFQEYLAADYAAREGLADDLAVRVTDSWWREVALLSLRCEPSEKYVETFFENLLSRGVLESNVDLASRCIGETIYFPPEPFLAVLNRPDATPAEIASVLRVLRGRQDRVPWLADRCDKFVISPHIEVSSIAREILVATGRVPAAPAASSPEPYSVRVDERTGLTLVWIPAGRFRMGSEKGHDDERPVHEVTLTRGFYMSKYPITNREYARYLELGNRQPSVPQYWHDRRFNQSDQPVVGVSWNEAVAYCEWAGGRLPTEAEWEFACRAGSNGEYCFGDDPTQLGEYAWFGENSDSQLQPVGRKKPNAWGLYDMHGNVWEWCHDWYGSYPSGAAIDPLGPPEGSFRVFRGGSWDFQASYCRSADRVRYDPSVRDYGLGFRLLLSPSE